MGGCAGLGGENGRSNGSAVSSSAARGCPQAGLLSVLGLIWMMNFSLAACSRENAPPPPNAATLLEAITAADPAKYPSPQASRRWSNPYLVIRPDAVGLVTGVTANEEQILQPGEVLNALARLPASAWPYGRAVAILVEGKPAASESDKVAIRRSRGIVEGDLESAHVAINWIPTS